MDWYGPKFIAVLGVALQAAGFFLIGNADSATQPEPHVEGLLFAGFALMATGGIGPYVSSFNFANLTTTPNTITSIIAALFNITGLTFFALTSILDKAGVSEVDQRKWICDCFGILAIIHIVVCYLLWPTKPFVPGSSVEKLITWEFCKEKEKKGELVKPFLETGTNTPQNLDSRRTSGAISPGYEDINTPVSETGYTPKTCDTPTSVTFGSPVLSSMNPIYIPLRRETWKNQLCSFEWFGITAFYSFFLLSMSFYFGSMNKQIDPDDKRQWLQTFGLCSANIVPVFLAIPAARILDKFGFAIGVAAVSLCCTVMNVLLIPTDNVPAYVCSLIVFAVLRTFLFPTFFGYVGVTFGFRNYGLVVGATTITQACVNQLSLPLNSIGFDGGSGFKWIDIGFAILAALFLPYALTLGVWEWEDENSQPHQPPNLLRRETLGRQLTFKWSRLANASPRATRKQKKAERRAKKNRVESGPHNTLFTPA